MHLGPNRHLIGQPADHPDFATPALLVDGDALDANIRLMAKLAADRGVRLRPHGKAHKSGILGRMQLEAGAIGICCATVLEAEVMGDAGIDGILVTTPVVTPSLLSRIVATREKVASLMVVADSETGVDRIGRLARRDKPIDVLVDVDMGLGRTGVPGAEEAVRVAARVAAFPALRYRGVQAYYGHLQHIPALDERHRKIAEQWSRLSLVVEALAAAGYPPEIVSGGGTGTHHLDLAHGPFTELQPGSYIFMDKQYGAVEIAPGGSPFRTALTVVARVVSTAQPDRVIVDAGSKALSTDAGPALVAGGVDGPATYQFYGDEHGAVRVEGEARRPELGSLISFVAPHCDPTVNLYDHFHIVRGGRLVDIWPIEARGH